MILQDKYRRYIQLIVLLMTGAMSVCNLCAQTAADSARIEAIRDSIIGNIENISFEDALPQYDQPDTLQVFNEDSLAFTYARELIDREERVDTYFENFNPKPLKAVWISALLPGAGQIYNRKYWKLPIIYGGYLGLLYGFNWNQKTYKTYQNAYRDLVNKSPNGSYLQLLPFRTLEEKKKYVSNNESTLKTSFQRKRNFYRTNRDYCIVGMIGVYLVSIVDAYVDAALYHFDVSPQLDACNNPTMMVSYKIDF